jgi:hypothetical protein
MAQVGCCGSEVGRAELSLICLSLCSTQLRSPDWRMTSAWSSAVRKVPRGTRRWAARARAFSTNRQHLHILSPSTAILPEADGA